MKPEKFPQKILAVTRTVYPLDYDKNNPKSDNGFNRFHQHIRETLRADQLTIFTHSNN